MNLPRLSLSLRTELQFFLPAFLSIVQFLDLPQLCQLVVGVDNQPKLIGDHIDSQLIVVGLHPHFFDAVLHFLEPYFFLLYGLFTESLHLSGVSHAVVSLHLLEGVPHLL